MRIAFISDIHEDIASLTRAFKIIEKAKCNEIVCLGDIVGFSVPFYKYYNTRDANACIKLISENAKYTVAGNHEHYALRKLPSFINALELPSNWYELPFYKRKEISENKIWLYEDNELSPLLNDNSKSWISSLPEHITIPCEEHKFFLSHYIYPDMTGISTCFINKKSEFSMHYDLMRKSEADLSVFGHAHPNGLHIVDTINHHTYNSKKVKFTNNIVGIGVPAITSSSYYSGFMIYDSDKRSFETFPVNTKFKLIKIKQ